MYNSQVKSSRLSTSIYKKIWFYSTVLSMGAFFLPTGNGYAQTVTVEGDVSPAGGAVSPVWNVGADLSLGATDGSTATLKVEGRGKVTSAEGRIGDRAGSKASALLTGAGSNWTTTGNFFIGHRGSGKLEVLDGASVKSGANLFIGMWPGSSGEVIVSGAGSTLGDDGTTYVGGRDVGTGTLTVQDGGQVNTKLQAYIGNTTGAESYALVTGKNSTWNVGGNLYVGHGHDAELDINKGGLVVSSWGTIGTYSGITGHVTIDGPNSSWQPLQTVTIGRSGIGIVDVLNGGSLLLSQYYDQSIEIGSEATAVGTLNIKGNG